MKKSLEQILKEFLFFGSKLKDPKQEIKDCVKLIRKNR
jgi:hypothetical protein